MASNFVKIPVVQLDEKGQCQGPEHDVGTYINKLAVVSIGASAALKNAAIIRFNDGVNSTYTKGNWVLARMTVAEALAALSFEIANPVVPG